MLLQYHQPDLDTFIADSKRLRRLLLVVGAIPTVLLGLPVLLALLFQHRVRALGTWLQQSGNEIWVPVAFLAFLATVFSLMAFLQRRVYANPRVCCPSCGKSLLRPFLSAVVIATGKCGLCGSQVLTPETQDFARNVEHRKSNVGYRSAGGEGDIQ